MTRERWIEEHAVRENEMRETKRRENMADENILEREERERKEKLDADRQFRWELSQLSDHDFRKYRSLVERNLADPPRLEVGGEGSSYSEEPDPYRTKVAKMSDAQFAEHMRSLNDTGGEAVRKVGPDGALGRHASDAEFRAFLEGIGCAPRSWQAPLSDIMEHERARRRKAGETDV